MISPSVSPRLPVPPFSDLLSKATVILCTREDFYYFLTTPPQSEPAHLQTPTVGRAADPLPESPRRANAEDDDDAMSDTASYYSSLSSRSNRIRKPEGEPGRPGRGGYNLESQLAWDKITYRRLRNVVYHSMKKHLDTTRSKSRQNHAAIRRVVQEAREAFPDLEDYAGCWPVQDLILTRLKYTSMRARRYQPKKVEDMEENQDRSMSSAVMD